MNVLRRPVVFSLGLIFLVLLGVGARWMLGGNGDDSEPSELAQEGAPQGRVLSGFVDVEEGIISLYPLVPGRVEKVLARENQNVPKGADLLLLNDRVAKLKLREAEADLKAAEAKLTGARLLPELHQSKLFQLKQGVEVFAKRLSGAQHKLKRAQDLYKTKFMSLEELKAATDQVKEMEAGARAEREKLRSLEKIDPNLDVIQAEANVEAKKAQLEEAKFGLHEQVLRAPAAGLVLRVNVGPGDVLGPIPKDAAILFCINQRRIIRANVEQEFANEIKVGRLVTVEDFINHDSTRWQGKIARIADVFMQPRTLQPQRITLSGDDTRTLECIIDLDPGQAPLRLGQRLRVTLLPK